MTPATHNLLRHLDNAEHFTLAGQTVRVGRLKGPQGLTLAVLAVSDCVNRDEALWLGARIKEDLLMWVRSAQPDAPDQMASVEAAAMPGSDRWQVGVYTYHQTDEDVAVVTTFWNQYAVVTVPVHAAPERPQ